MQKGVGLNSIPNRFALLSGTIAVIFVAVAFLGFAEQFQFSVVTFFAAFSIIVVPTLITYLAANKLTQQITELKSSADKIAQGNFDHPIDVDCACEIGGLADSFRGLVGRINANVLRMNVLAYTDAATKLPNRTVVAHLLEEIKCDESLTNCAVLFMDINGFKRINDTFGHNVGDEVLIQASDRIVRDGFNRSQDQLDMCMSTFGELCQRAPKDIIVARYAGDEFVAILPGYHSDQELKAVSERITEALEKPFYCNSNKISAGVSIGVAKYPEDTDNPMELIKYSDMAMYDAKRNKESSFSLFQKSMQEGIDYRNRIENDLREALKSDQIYLQFQPKVNVISGELAGVEALARWKHPELGMISPEDFISVAEDTGLIIPLGKKVMELALKQSRIWSDEGVCRKIAINIAPSQFEAQNFLADTLDLLETYNVPAKSVELEITESMAMSKFGETKRQLDLLRQAGISIGLDDFGIGFSNLSQLSNLAIDTLKIDKSLISDIGVTPKNEAILMAIINMAKALGFETVAEGIETEDQYRFLERADCDTIQGYLLGKPMMPEDITAWEKNYSHPRSINKTNGVHKAA